MNVAARPAGYDGNWPVRYDGRERYEWPDHHHWHGHHWHGRVLWHAGPGLIGLMILGFLFCWPLGVVALALMIWSAKMTCGHRGGGHWGESHGGEGRWAGRWQERMMAKRAHWEQRMAEHMERHQQRSGTGNRAFDEYRAETLRRLEDEEKEFREFLNNLRFAKDKAEFDDFLANRRGPTPPEADAPPQN
jgi:Protein of unknown function (DUF2852)